MTEVADILDRAADLIEPEGAWTRRAAARTASGIEVCSADTDAVCWCSIGAINRATADIDAVDDRHLAYRLLEGVIGSASIENWNDAPGRTQEEAVIALRAAAEKARTASSVGTQAKGRSEPKSHRQARGGKGS